MGDLTSRTPKVLLPVFGKSLILYPIEALIRAGISEIAIIVGHLGDEVEKVLREHSVTGVTFHYVRNPDHGGGNAISVSAGGDWAAGEPFILCMGDHIMRRDYVSRFMEGACVQETLGSISALALIISWKKRPKSR